MINENYKKDSLRQRRVSTLIQKDLSQIFHKEKNNLLKGNFVSISEVGISSDLKVAKIYISMTMVNQKNELLDHIQSKKSEIRGLLGNMIGKQVRAIPELVFYIDELEEEAQRINKMIDELNIPPESEEE